MESFSTWIKEQSGEHLLLLKNKADNAYYNSSSPILTDTQWDCLNDVLVERNIIDGSKIGHDALTNNKCLLQEPLWSLDKSVNTKSFERWLNRNTCEEYIAENKIDGVSGFLQIENGNYKLFTRGNGIIGTDISHICKHMSLPRVKESLTIRGEIVMSHLKFEKYKDKYNNSRNLVSGFVNSKRVKEGLCDLEFVAYELFYSDMKPSQQLIKLRDLGFTTVNYSILKNVSYDHTVNILSKERDQYIFPIDGIVVQTNTVYDREKTKNPGYAIAVKAQFEDNIASSTIVKVHWNKCRMDVIKPKIEIVPKKINNVTIRFLTAYNAKYVKDKKISEGDHVTFTRAGDVIPAILHITNITDDYDMPQCDYYWNDTNVDIISSTKTSESAIKEIYNFFSQLDVEFVGEQTVTKFYNLGFDSIEKILNCTVGDVKKLDKVGDVLSLKIYNNIQKVYKKDICDIVAATGFLGKGLAAKKCRLLIDNIPNIFEDVQINNIEESINNIKGFSEKSALKIIKNLEKTKSFIKSNNFKITSNTVKNEQINVCFSGMRPSAETKQLLSKKNFHIQDNVTKQTSYLVVKDLKSSTGKTETASRLEINTITFEDFKKLL